MQPIYSTIGFIQTLRAEKRGWVTYLIDTPTNMTFGYFIEIGPMTIFKIKGWRGEKATVVRIFSKEVIW